LELRIPQLPPLSSINFVSLNKNQNSKSIQQVNYNVIKKHLEAGEDEKDDEVDFAGVKGTLVVNVEYGSLKSIFDKFLNGFH